MLDRVTEAGGLGHRSSITATDIRSIMTSLILVMFLGSVEQAIVGPALPAIGAGFHQMQGISWIVTAYLMCSIPSTLVVGALSDIFGRRITLLGSLAVFMVGSIVCALAPSLTVLVMGRFVQGLGGGGLLSLPNTIVADLVAPRERGRYQVYISGTYAIAGLSGPILGGVLAAFWSWRMVFWVFVPLAGAAMFLTESTLRRLPPHKERRHFDLVGALLLSSALVLLLLAVQSVAGESLRMTLTFLGGAISVIASFIVYEQGQVDPLLPVSLLRSKIAGVTSGGAFLVMSVNASLAAYLPIYWERRYDFSISDSGLALTLPLLGIVAGAYASGQYMRYFGRYKTPPIVGSLCGSAAYLLLARSGQDAPMSIYALTLIAGFGSGACLPPMLVAMQNSVPRPIMGAATSLQICARSVGGMLGVAIFGLVILGDYGANVRFVAFFEGCSAILFLAALVLMLFLPEQPFRSVGAIFESSGA